MGQAHDPHHDGDTYLLDQLCLIGLSAAFGGICLRLYYWQTDMLRLLLAPQFDPFVLLSGVALLALVVVRSLVLWHSVRKHSGQVHDHNCHHDHQHHDHEHGVAPWRYVLLLVPVMLFMLGAPNKLPSVSASTKVDLSKETLFGAGLIGLGQMPFVQAGSLLLVLDDPVARGVQPEWIEFKALEALAWHPANREAYDGKTVEVMGQYAPTNAHLFSLVRFRIGCCGGDIVEIKIPVICQKPIIGFRKDEWVRVTGSIEFRALPGRSGLVTLLRITRAENIKKTDPDPNPYIQ